MARLIPAFIDDNSPPGERSVFNLLASGPDDWVILHSLDLAPWNNRRRTEIDFVVIVPDSGILCIEVKSHEDIRFDGSRWWPHDIKRSPFKQATDARYALLRGLAEKLPDFKKAKVPIVHICIFPNSPFPMSTNVLSVHPGELMDSNRFQQFTSGDDFCSEIRKMIQDNLQVENLSPPVPALSEKWIENLVKTCVPVQKRHPDAREAILRRQHELEKLLLNQQKQVLMLAARNDRLIVSGGAGTGKTLIAMEVAKRKAESGLRVALFCFNRLVGDWVSKQMEQSSVPLPNLVVGRANQMMARMVDVTVPSNAPQSFWDTEFPAKLEERLTDPEFNDGAAFDYLVLDEAQDLFARPRLWACLSRFLKGGLKEGSFALFGDFKNQVLSNSEVMQRELENLREYARPVNCHLSENCRNYKIVGEMAVALSGLREGGQSPVYDGYLRAGGEKRNYNISYYEDTRTQINQIKAWLKDFVAQGFKPWEITLLSFCSEEESAAMHLIKESCKLDPAWMESHNSGYTTVHSFKGMENKVIILTDVDLNGRDVERSLFYTGMTRATESVRVLCTDSSRQTLISYLINQ
jgi:hypothetical protein